MAKVKKKKIIAKKKSIANKKPVVKMSKEKFDYFMEKISSI
jgi:hypothetical protein